jgi:pimeloyl-ACP methyl ester carboxylesterase
MLLLLLPLSLPLVPGRRRYRPRRPRYARCTCVLLVVRALAARRGGAHALRARGTMHDSHAACSHPGRQAMLPTMLLLPVMCALVLLPLTGGSAMVGNCDLASDARCTIRGVQFELFAPSAGCSAQAPCGLILDVHGHTMSGAMEVKNTKMDTLGPAAGYIVAAPTSPDVVADGPTWIPANGHARLQGFLEAASAAGGVDSDRVHVMGFSQGGFATWNLLCMASAVVCSIAPLAASGRDPWGAGYGSTCYDSGTGPAVHRPIFYTTGRLDPLAWVGFGNAQRDFVLEDYGLSDSGVAHMYHSAQYSTRIWSKPGRTTFRMDDHDFAGNLYPTIGGHCFPRTGSDCDCPPYEFGTGPLGDTLWNHGCCSTGESLHWPTEALAFFAQHPCSWLPAEPEPELPMGAGNESTNSAYDGQSKPSAAVSRARTAVVWLLVAAASIH